MTSQGVPSIVMLEKNLLASGMEFIWLYEIEVPTSPPTRYRFVRDTASREFRGNTYSPFPISHSDTKQDTKGNLPTVTLSVSNATREIIDTLNTYNGLIGQPVRVLLTHELALSTNEAIIEHEYQITNTTVNEESVTAILGDLHIYNAKVPAQRMMRFYCRHQYKDARCGYAVPTDSAHYLPTCDKSLYGANGCKIHGTSEANAGLAVIHPRRFGGFPGIPEETTRGGLQ